MTTIRFAYDTVYEIKTKEGKGAAILKTDKGNLTLLEITPKEAETIYERIRKFWDDKSEVYLTKEKAVFLKSEDKIYYAPIDEETKVNTYIHKCAQCRRYCEKVKNVASQIWKYNYIRFGIETVGTVREQLIVYSCKKFDVMENENTKRKSLKEMLKHIDNIEDLMEGSAWQKMGESNF